jgi:hypothetical protein
MKPEQLVIRRRGDPHVRPGPGGTNGGKLFVPRSTMRAIAASGWVNYRTVTEDPNKLTAEKAAELLYTDPARPPALTQKVLAQRVRRFMACGAIATKTIEFKGGRRPWVYATPADVRALRDAIFMSEADVFAQRLSGPRMALLRRHEPELLRRPRDLALQQASGELAEKLRTWFEWEQRAARDLHWRKTRSWALVTEHIARTLEAIGPKTKIGGRKRLRTYHLGPCATGLVEVPLWLARKRGLECCEHCAFESKFRRNNAIASCRSSPASSCRTTYRRGRGRPPKLPTCPTERQDHDRVDAMPGFAPAVWNPTTGCTRVSAGCDNCYAFALHDKRFNANLAAAIALPYDDRDGRAVQAAGARARRRAAVAEAVRPPVLARAAARGALDVAAPHRASRPATSSTRWPTSSTRTCRTSSSIACSTSWSRRRRLAPLPHPHEAPRADARVVGTRTVGRGRTATCAASYERRTSGSARASRTSARLTSASRTCSRRPPRCGSSRASRCSDRYICSAHSRSTRTGASRVTSTPTVAQARRWSAR